MILSPKNITITSYRKSFRLKKKKNDSQLSNSPHKFEDINTFENGSLITNQTNIQQSTSTQTNNQARERNTEHNHSNLAQKPYKLLRTPLQDAPQENKPPILPPRQWTSLAKISPPSTSHDKNNK